MHFNNISKAALCPGMICKNHSGAALFSVFYKGRYERYGLRLCRFSYQVTLAALFSAYSFEIYMQI